MAALGGSRYRPKLELPWTRLEIALNGLAIAALLAQIGVAIWAFGTLPERIPIHFSAAGEVDGWGGRGVLLALPLVAAALLVPMLFLQRFPHAYNFPWPITAENASRQYRLARTLLAGVGLSIVVTFFTILLAMIAGARDEHLELTWLLPAILLASFLPIVLYFVAAYRGR